jgi:RNA polymerase sigma factor (sigma-70 family)
LTKEEFKILFDKHFDSLRQYVLYRSGDADLATDIAQDCFLKLWEKQNKVDLSTSKGLLFKMANDIFITRYNKEKATFEFLKNFTLLELDYSPHEVMEFEQLKTVYERALTGMGENQRTVFLMSRVDGLKYSEIAESLGVGVKAVEKRMNLALNFLRKSINRDE